MKKILDGILKFTARRRVAGGDLHHEVHLIAERTAKSVGVHLILLVCATSVLGYQNKLSLWSWIFSSMIVVMCGGRFILSEKLVNEGRISAKSWQRIFATLVLVQAFAWGGLAAVPILRLGLNHELSFIILLLTAGLASGSMAALTPWKRISDAFILLTMGLPITAMVILDFREHLVLCVALLTYMAFMRSQSTILQNMFVSIRDREMRSQSMNLYGLEGVLIHQAGKIVEVNNAFLQIFGIDRESALSRSIFSFIRPDYLSAAREQMKEDNNAWELVGVREDGSDVFIESWAHLIDFGGEPARVTYVRDIGSRKKIENALRESERTLQEFMTTAFDSLSDVLLVMTMDGKFESGNRKWRDFSGADSHETSQESFLLSVATDDHDAVAKFLKPNQLGEREMSARLLRKSDQTYRWHLGRSSPVHDRNGVVTKWFISWTDVHEQILGLKRNHELEVSAKSAHEATQIKSAFLATMSHEIRTPLNAIIGLSDLLLDIPASSLQNKYQRTLKDSAESLLVIVNDILDLSKIESGKMAAEEVEFELTSVIEFQVEMLATRARDKSLSIGSFIDPNIPSSLLGDSSRLAQVVLNLLSNAVKFTKSGGVVVRANLLYQNVSEAWIRMEIEDSGIGMSKDEQNKLFQPFSQVDTSHSRKYGGTGLGLSICLGLVQMMGGRVFVHSETGSGSVFTVDLPFKLNAASAATSPLKSTADSGEISTRLLSHLSADRPFKSQRALILDNDPLAYSIKSSYLSAWGWTSSHVSLRQLVDQGARALDGVDMILVDSSLSTSLFSKVISWFQQNSAHPDCLLLLAANENERHLAPQATATQKIKFLSKPVRREEFARLISGVESTALAAPNRAAQDLAASAPDLQGDGEGSVAQVVDKRILVVEDNSTNQMLIKALLKKLGYVPHVVANGFEAIEALRQESFDLILMDCQMPEMDGFEATTRIRATEAQQNKSERIAIIALTANVRVEDRERCLAVGMNDFLSKPVRRDDLSQKLQLWLAA